MSDRQREELTRSCFYCGEPVGESAKDPYTALYFCGCSEGAKIMGEEYERAEAEQALYEQIADMHRW